MKFKKIAEPPVHQYGSNEFTLDPPPKWSVNAFKYPVGSGMLYTFLQRCVAKLDENGTTAGIVNKDMASPLDKAFKPFRKILDEFCSPKNHLKIHGKYLFKRIRKIRGKNLCVRGEDTKSLSTCSFLRQET
jgi:hypothetical protein